MKKEAPYTEAHVRLWHKFYQMFLQRLAKERKKGEEDGRNKRRR